jgi:SRSO17 transposase
LPEEWAEDLERRAKTHVPRDIEFQKNWQLADLLLQRVSPRVSHAWVVGDDEYGRPQEFRDRLADRKERYLFEVPCNTNVRRPGATKWESVQKLKKKRQRWAHFRLRDGEKGPLEVKAFSMKVETPRKGAPVRQETLLIMQTIEGNETWYYLAPRGTIPDTAELVRAAAHRHHIEQLFESAKGDVGLDHYEVRSWIGWHHHMTLSMLALWFLVLERRRLGKKLPPLPSPFFASHSPLC